MKSLNNIFESLLDTDIEDLTKDFKGAYPDLLYDGLDLEDDHTLEVSFSNQNLYQDTIDELKKIGITIDTIHVISPRNGAGQPVGVCVNNVNVISDHAIIQLGSTGPNRKIEGVRIKAPGVVLYGLDEVRKCIIDAPKVEMGHYVPKFSFTKFIGTTCLMMDFPFDPKKPCIKKIDRVLGANLDEYSDLTFFKEYKLDKYLKDISYIILSIETKHLPDLRVGGGYFCLVRSGQPYPLSAARTDTIKSWYGKDTWDLKVCVNDEFEFNRYI